MTTNTRMLWAILNKSWRQHPTKQQLYGHLPPITKTIKIRRTKHVGHFWRSRDELISDVLLWTPTIGRAKAVRPARTCLQQLCEDTGCSTEDLRKRWTIERVAREGQGYPCWWHDKMKMIYQQCVKMFEWGYMEAHEMDTLTWVQTQDEAFSISHSANTFGKVMLYDCGRFFFYIIIFVGYILSFGLVRLRTIRLSARAGAHIESRCSWSCGEDVTITDVEES